MFADNYSAGGCKGSARLLGEVCGVSALVLYAAARGGAMERDLSCYYSGITV